MAVDTHNPGSMMSNIFVSGFIDSTTQQDLRTLFGKVVQIESIYMPGPSPTGLKRKFAMLKSSSDQSEVAKCIKKLNKCFWKGGTLVVEPASEHYDDRFRREGQEANEADEKARRDIVEAAAEPMPAFEQDHLRLKRSIGHRGIGDHLIVSTEQLMRKSNRRAFILRGEHKHEVMSCGRRLLFEYSEEGAMTEREVDAWGNDIELNENQSCGDNQYVQEREQEQEEREGVEEAPSAPAPTGQRRGFGTLLPQIKPVKASSRESATKFQAIMDDADAHFAPPEGARALGLRDVNDLVQENVFNEEDMVEVVPHNDDDEHVPAASAHELQAEELKGARERALALATLAMHGEGGGATGVGATQDVTESTYSRGRVFKSGWDTTTIAHFDPSREDSSQYLMDNEEAELLLQRARERKAEKEKEKEKAAGDKSNNDDHDIDDGSRVGEKPLADLNKLKDIFQKDGGVWFGDDGTLKDSVSKGGAVQDEMFLEAEKFGFDIRSAGTGGGAQEGMTFGFSFGGDGEEPSKMMANGGGDEAEALHPARSADSVPSRVDGEDENATEFPVAADGGVTVAVMSLIDVVTSARSFRRNVDDDDEVVQTWRNTRDKLVVNYKRRKTDARKKTAKYGALSSTATPSSAEVGRRKSRGGKKHRKK